MGDGFATGGLGADRFLQLSGANKCGMVLAGLLGLVDVPTALYSAPAGMVSPHRAVLVSASVCGALTLVGVVAGLWRRYHWSFLTVLGSRLVSMLLGLAAFTVSPVESNIRAFAVASIPLTLIAVALILWPKSTPRNAGELAG